MRRDRTPTGLSALLIGLLTLLSPIDTAAQDSRAQPLVTKTYELGRFGGQIPGPVTPAEFAGWLADLQRWRRERHIRMGYDGSEYEAPELQWAQQGLRSGLTN